MDHLLSTQNICHSFGAHTLFTNISLNFNEKCRIGLIGPNGSGKSTFLEIISEKRQPDSGKIFKKKNVRIVYISQHDDFDESQSIEDLVASYAVGADATERLSLTRRHLSAANFTDTTTQVSALSGGWKKKVSIVCGLVQNPDLLLLDEPTNHLDIGTILWLEQTLKQAKFGFVAVSHDRQFLENIAEEVIEINKCYPEGSIRFAGNYSNFLLRRSQFLESQQEAETTLANKVRRETAWLRRGPKARATKAKYRIDEAHKMQSDLADLKKLNSSTSQQMQAGLMATGRKTKKLFSAESIQKSWDTTPLFKDLSFILGPGDRLGLVGKNGCGKTSLMHIIAGKDRPDSGTVTYADKVKITLFDQKREQLDQNQTLRQALAPDGDSVLYQGRPIHVAGWAKRFLFSPDQLEMPVSHLSGGEQARILIAGFMTTEADIILLDEPTNDLDIESIEVLEESLQEFSGAIVLVSHDRAFLNSIATEVIGFNPATHNCQIYGDCEQWLRDTSEKPKQKKAKKSTPAKNQPKVKLSYKEEKELEAIESLIHAAEAELETCQDKVSDLTAASDPEYITLWCETLAGCQEKVDGLYERWDELEEKKTAIEN